MSFVEKSFYESLKGLIRQYFKKESEFKNLTHERVKQVEIKLYNRSRKKSNYENPIFVIEQLFFKQKVAFVTCIQLIINEKTWFSICNNAGV
jgi:transposase, IS30 family